MTCDSKPVCQLIVGRNFFVNINRPTIMCNMTDFIILGTDTNAGKTTFALLWLHLFAEQWEYWKPIETGDSDAERVATLCSQATVHPPLRRFHAPVAPPLAAKREGAVIPAAREIAGGCPRALNGERGLVIETFGGPFSPLNENELQLALIRALGRPCVLVSSTKLGGIGRTLQCLTALAAEGVQPDAVILLGELDAFAEEQVRRHRPEIVVVSLQSPDVWTTDALRECASKQKVVFERVRRSLSERANGRPARPICGRKIAAAFGIRTRRWSARRSRSFALALRTNSCN